MLKLVKLNLEIEKLLQFDIEYNHSVQNFLYNDNWVTEIPSSYFDKTKEKIEILIDENIDYSDEANIIFIENLLSDVQIFLTSLKEKLDSYSSNNFANEDWSNCLAFPVNPPRISTLDLPEPSPKNNFDDRSEYIIEIIIGFFNINSTYIENEELTLDDILINENNIDNNDLAFIYAKAHLTYILTLHEKMVKEIGDFLNSIIKVYNRRKTFVEENLSSIVPENLSLEFNISKTNLGHLFYNLYEIGILAKDKTDVKDERTNLKNYLNHANIFYLDKSKFIKAEKMTRAMPVLRNTDSKEVKKEITFLKDLTERLDERINSLTQIYTELKKRGH